MYLVAKKSCSVHKIIVQSANRKYFWIDLKPKTKYQIIFKYNVTDKKTYNGIAVYYRLYEGKGVGRGRWWWVLQ